MSDVATPVPARTERRPVPDAADRTHSVKFMLESVKDIQGTIRAIDTKVSILLAALSIPLKNVADGIVAWRQGGFAVHPDGIVAFFAVAAYGLAVGVAVRTLSGIGDATAHVEGARKHTAFYGGGLFPFTWLDATFNRTSVVARRSVDDYVREVPRSYDEVVIELTSEVMSLAYIRDLKALRQRAAYRWTVVAAALGALALLI